MRKGWVNRGNWKSMKTWLDIDIFICDHPENIAGMDE
jgi:hypothetical protein